MPFLSVRSTDFTDASQPGQNDTESRMEVPYASVFEGLLFMSTRISTRMSTRTVATFATSFRFGPSGRDTRIDFRFGQTFEVYSCRTAKRF